jgi:glucose/mannose transport system substrate-binding protein
MTNWRRRDLLVGAAAAVATSGVGAKSASAQTAGKPRVTVITQWSAGSDGAAITALGDLFTKAGGDWQHNPVPGFTTDMMNKLRAQILSDDPPAVSQLKGPEIAAWSKIAPTVNLDADVAAAGYENVVAPELVKLHKPFGHWIALPLQVYRINSIWISKKAADKVGLTALPKTWADYNAIGEKMAKAGIQPVANGGTKWDNGMIWEIALSGISPSAYRRAVMQLDAATLGGPEVLAAFEQTRRMSLWMDPNTASQHYSTFIPKFMNGDAGMLLMGGWVQGVYKKAGYQYSDYVTGPAPQDNGKAAFDLNADAFIFWQRKEPDFTAGQHLLAKLVMEKDTQAMYSGITGSLPVRTDMDLSGPAFSDAQREASASLGAAVKNDQAVLSLAHNMAQPNQVTAAMIDVLTEFVTDHTITPKQGQTRLAEAVDNIR